MLGRSFKEDCPDTRNSKTFPLMDALWNRGAEVFNFDPVAFDDHFEGGRGAKTIEDPAEAGPMMPSSSRSLMPASGSSSMLRR